MYYFPELANGQPASLPWQIRMIRANVIAWPRADEAPRWLRPVELLYSIFGFTLFLLLHYANFYFFYLSFPSLTEILACFSTYLVLVEGHFRVYHMAFHKQSFKKFLKYFYKHIFVDHTTHPEIVKTIRYKSLPTIYYSILYVLTYIVYFSLLVQGWFHDERNLMYKQAYPFDIQPMPVYLPVMVMNFWIGLVCISQFFGETNILATCILHVNGRYHLIQQDLQKFVQQLLSSEVHAAHIAREFREGFVKFIKRNAELNRFVVEMEQTFTFNLFVIFSLSSVGLCALFYNIMVSGFSWKSGRFYFFLFGKVSELFVLGELGTTLIRTTDNLSNVYFHCGWEDIILRSNDAEENVRAMKLVLMAMEVNTRPMNLTGLNFFNVSISAVLTILQCAFSYFTFLHAVG